MPWALVVLPVGSCWLQGRAEFVEGAGHGHTVRSQGEWGCGQAVGSWFPSPGRQRCCCYFFMAHYLGAILRFPQSRHAEPSVPGAPASRAEAGSLQKPFQSPASELAAVFPAEPDVCWSPGTGEPQRRRSLGLDGWCCPLWLPGKAGPGLELVFGTRLSGWHQGRLSLLAWAYPLSTGTALFMSTSLTPAAL